MDGVNIAIILTTIGFIYMYIKLFRFVFRLRSVTVRRLYIIAGLVWFIVITDGGINFLLWTILIFYIFYTFFASIMAFFVRLLGWEGQVGKMIGLSVGLSAIVTFLDLIFRRGKK